MALNVQKYSGVAVLLHWIIAVLIIGNLILSHITELIPEESIRFAIDTHKSVGITVLGLVTLRILWRVTHKPPPPAEGLKSWERRLSKITHGLLYFLMVAMPLTGWMHDSAWKAAPEIPMRWFGLFEWPRIGAILTTEPERKEQVHGILGNWHENMGYLLIALVLLHIAGALKHQLLDGEPLLQRMWR